jgi:3-hydroxyisobutyryl-CoA hydrolase
MRENAEKSRYSTYQREYSLASHFVDQPDFVEGVTARLITRTEARWSLPPSALTEPLPWVQENIIDPGHFNDPLHDPFYLLQKEKGGSVAEPNLFKYSLPMEAQVLSAIIRGKLDASADEDAPFSRKEFMEAFVGERLGKAGAERKLNYILDRRTMEDESGKLVWKFDSTF